MSSADGLKRGRENKNTKDSVSSPSRREAARREQAKRDTGINPTKKVYISPKVLLDKAFGERYNISRVQRQQVA